MIHIANTINSNAIGIQIGARTHIQDQSILCWSFKTIKIIVNNSKKVGPIVIVVFVLFENFLSI